MDRKTRTLQRVRQAGGLVLRHRGLVVADKMRSSRGDADIRTGVAGEHLQARISATRSYLCEPMSRAKAWSSIGFCRNPSKGQAWPVAWFTAALMRISIDAALRPPPDGLRWPTPDHWYPAFQDQSARRRIACWPAEGVPRPQIRLHGQAAPARHDVVVADP